MTAFWSCSALASVASVVLACEIRRGSEKERDCNSDFVARLLSALPRRSTTRARARESQKAALTSRDENHVCARQRFFDLRQGFRRGRLPHLGLAPGAEATRHSRPERDLHLRRATST